MYKISSTQTPHEKHKIWQDINTQISTWSSTHMQVKVEKSHVNYRWLEKNRITHWMWYKPDTFGQIIWFLNTFSSLSFTFYLSCLFCIISSKVSTKCNSFMRCLICQFSEENDSHLFLLVCLGWGITWTCWDLLSSIKMFVCSSGRKVCYTRYDVHCKCSVIFGQNEKPINMPESNAWGRYDVSKVIGRFTCISRLW